jgi:hypothetical protein
VSRSNTDVNLGQHRYITWASTKVDMCDGSESLAVEPQDVRICNGQLRESTNDNEGQPFLELYPKQPFDFSGRTGTIVFDVTQDQSGGHGVWPELWVSDKPVPHPNAFEGGGFQPVPQNGFGLRFNALGNLPGSSCSDTEHSWGGAGTVVVSRNYVVDDTSLGSSDIHTQYFDCARMSSGANGPLNHVEVQVSANQIDVWSTDAGNQTGPLHHLSQTHLNNPLAFSRGLIWLVDTHYNATKCQCGSPTPDVHTFTWDNVGFDGPVLPRDLAFDAPDTKATCASCGNDVFLNQPLLNLGYPAVGGNPATIQIPNVSGMQNTNTALLVFQTTFFGNPVPPTVNYVVNGYAHSASTNGLPWEDLALPVPISDVVAGTNTVQLSTSVDSEFDNIDLILVGAGGGGSTSGSTTPIPVATGPSSSPGQQYAQTIAKGDSIQVTCMTGTLTLVSQSQSSDVLACN